MVCVVLSDLWWVNGVVGLHYLLGHGLRRHQEGHRGRCWQVWHLRGWWQLWDWHWRRQQEGHWLLHQLGEGDWEWGLNLEGHWEGDGQWLRSVNKERNLHWHWLRTIHQ